MLDKPDKPYVIASLLLHLVILVALIVSFEFSAPVAVIKNSTKQDVISAVVLGDIPKSNILPHEPPPPPPKTLPEKVTPNIEQATNAVKAPPKPAPVKEAVKQEKAIVLNKKKPQPKKMEKKPLPFKASDLLAEFETLSKQKKSQQKKHLTKSFSKTLKQQAEASLRQQLLEENSRLKAIREREAQGEVNQYKALILQAISENWVIPLQANKKLTSELLIKLLPTGEVVSVTIIKSSGDPSLDSSARVAVLKSSPLPVPKEADTFSAFKSFVLKVKPENIMDVNG